MKRGLIIAIDGPAGSGKSTVGLAISQKFNYQYLDTGAMYRALTWKALTKKINLNSEKELAHLADKIKINFIQENLKKKPEIFVDGKNISREIRLTKVDNSVSLVSSYPLVRKKMVQLQQKMIKDGGFVVEGRDIGTVVCPDAYVKIYLTASAQERTSRRQKDLLDLGRKVKLKDLKEEIVARDKFDSERKNSPLKKAEDAYEIDTTELTFNQVVRKISNIVMKKIGVGS